MTVNEELYYVNHATQSTTWSRPRWTGSDGEDICEPLDALSLLMLLQLLEAL